MTLVTMFQTLPMTLILLTPISMRQAAGTMICSMLVMGQDQLRAIVNTRIQMITSLMIMAMTLMGMTMK